MRPCMHEDFMAALAELTTTEELYLPSVTLIRERGETFWGWYWHENTTHLVEVISQ